ncbi:PorV/PorQ family protein [Rhodocaloribacter litoris]|nr:PorV/PorQ family protein [Rhodocaloribacter litoris]
MGLAPGGTVYGQAAGAFARIGFGARGVALGNALVADGFGEASPYYNPALAPFTARQNIELSAALLRFDRELQHVQFAAPLRPRAGIALGLIHAGVSNIDGRDGSGFHTGTLSVDEFALFMAFGLRVTERITAGAGLQFFRTDLFDGLQPVNSIGLDLGLTVQVSEALHLGFVVDDLLARYSFNTSSALGSQGGTTSDRFPLRLRLGGAYRLLDGRMTLLAEYESRITSMERRTPRVELSDGIPRAVTERERLDIHENRLRFGGEYRPAPAFAVRGGVERLGTGALEGARPTAGFMVEQPVGELVARAEYTVGLEPFAEGTLHLLTLRVFF